MKKLNIFMKPLISLLVAVAVVSVFTLTSFAAPDAVGTVPAEFPEAGLDKDATLVANGSVTVNGNEARSGMTVVSGSTVTTGDHSIAMVESNVFGRVTLGPGTTAKIIYSAGNIRIESTCKDMRVACKEGQCTVSDKNKVVKVLTTGQDEHFDNAVDVAANAFVDVVVNCGEDKVCPAPFVPVVAHSSFLLALLILGGAATGVTIGILGGGTTSTRTPVSGVQP